MFSQRIFLKVLWFWAVAINDPRCRGDDVEEVLQMVINGKAVELRFNAESDLTTMARTFSHHHHLRPAVLCHNELDPEICAAQHLVEEMKRLLKPPPCQCHLELPLPGNLSVWLLRTVAITAILETRDCINFPSTSVFAGTTCMEVLALPGSMPSGLVGRKIFDQCFDQRGGSGEFSIKFPEDTVDSGNFLVTLTTVFESDHPCAAGLQIASGGRGQLSVNASATISVRPFTTGDPKDVLTSEVLTRRAAAGVGSCPDYSSSDPGRHPSLYAFASLLYSDDYLPGVLALAASLKATGTMHALMVLAPMSEQGLAVSDETVKALHAVGASVEVVHLRDTLGLTAGLVKPGLALPSLGQGVWLKLHLWRLTQFRRVVYIDADALVLKAIDELFCLSDSRLRLERFAASGDYFAGAFFTLAPDLDDFERMTNTLSRASGDVFVYGEQDFLNDFWRVGRRTRNRASLDYRYHCLAEDIGTEGRDNGTIQHEAQGDWQGDSVSLATITMEDSCKIVEYASCDPQGIMGVRWKPWMNPEILQGNLVCKYPPTEAFWRMHGRWLSFYQTALETVAVSVKDTAQS